MFPRLSQMKINEFSHTSGIDGAHDACQCFQKLTHSLAHFETNTAVHLFKVCDEIPTAGIPTHYNY